MNVAYFDCFAGASGDMILGALVDAGLEINALRDALSSIAPAGWELRAEKISARGIAASRVQVITRDQVRERRYIELDTIIASSSLEGEVKATTQKILRRIAQVEAKLHDEKVEQVRLHELGGIDTLIDIAGCVVGLRMLKVEEIFVSAFPMGHGTVNSRHGMLPLPAPAVAELVRGAPIRAMDIEAELVTPTGAAILTTLAHGYGTFPAMTVERVGYGAGKRELPIPNILRVFIGQTPNDGDMILEMLTLIETNIDDANPQIYDHLQMKLVRSGALDVWLAPIQMKKNRPGTLLSLLCPVKDADAMIEILFEEGITLGVRRREVQRFALAREIVAVETPFGSVRVKIAKLRGRAVRVAPEYDDCHRLAETHCVPWLDVFRAAEAAARALK